MSSSATGRQSHELSGGKRGSFFKSIFGDSSKIPSRDPPKSKGKGRAVPSSPTSPSADSEYVVVASPRLPLPQGSAPRYTNSIYVLDRGVGDLALSRAETSVSQSSAGGPLDRESSISSSASLFRQTIQTPSLPPTPPSPPRPPTATPPDTSASRWATAFVRLPVAKGQAHAPILFFQLMEAPARDPSTSATGNEDTLKSWDTGWLLLAASTSKGVYLFESKPALSRTWTPKPEIYVRSSSNFLLRNASDPSSKQKGSGDAALHHARPRRPFALDNTPKRQAIIYFLFHAFHPLRSLHFPRHATRVGTDSPLRPRGSRDRHRPDGSSPPGRESL